MVNIILFVNYVIMQKLTYFHIFGVLYVRCLLGSIEIFISNQNHQNSKKQFLHMYHRIYEGKQTLPLRTTCARNLTPRTLGPVQLLGNNAS